MLLRVGPRLGAWAALAALAWLSPAACSGPDQTQQGLPAGALIAGETRILTHLLEGVSQLEGTPLARGASALVPRIAGCSEFVGISTGGEPDRESDGVTGGETAGQIERLLASIRCAPSDSLPEAVRELRGDAPIVFILPLRAPGTDDSSRLLGRVRMDESGALRVDAHFDRLPQQGMAGLLLPSAKAVGPPRLSTRDSLLHARFAPESGLDIAAWVPQGSQADRLFALRSRLFAGSVLDGSLELAIYLPPEGQRMPLLVLAAGTRLQVAAVAAMEAFIGELEARWPLHHEPRDFGPNRSGACMPTLRLFSEFAPCYVATDEQLIVGWNEQSIIQALSPHVGPGPGVLGGLVLHLDRLAEADQKLHRALAPDWPEPRLRYAWPSLSARAIRDGDDVLLQLALGPADALLAPPGASH